MIGSTAGNLERPGVFNLILSGISKAVRMIISFRPRDLLSEDLKYRVYYYRSFIPDLYRRHSSQKTANCLFCRHLVKSEYHRYCLICTKGTYDHCYLPLPAILYEDSASADSSKTLFKPWYFMKTCSSFERLPGKQYARNLRFLLSSITIHNYETLEGLENGILSGSRPCYICACVDYDLYKRCKRQGDYDICSPCPIIRKKLESVYENRRSSIRPAG